MAHRSRPCSKLFELAGTVMLAAFFFMGAGIVAQVMYASFKDSFFVDKRLERARRAAEETLNRT